MSAPLSAPLGLIAGGAAEGEPGPRGGAEAAAPCPSILSHEGPQAKDLVLFMLQKRHHSCMQLCV